MRRSSAPDLAFVLDAEERARRHGAAAAEKSRKRRRSYRRLAAGTFKKPKPLLSREERLELFKAAQRKRLATIAERNHQADKLIPVAWRNAEELQEFLDEGFDWAESKAALEVRHAKVRALVALRFDELAAWAEGHGLVATAAEYRTKVAGKLRAARTAGWWGFDRITGKRFMRFRDRSGLVRLDPSESRRDTARLIMRYVPVALTRIALGERLTSAVFSMPNVPRGQLAWGKAELFRETARFFRHFPEVTGRIEVQEDPLAADLQSWNVHNNVIVLFDPKRVTCLAPELMQQAELRLPGELAKLPTAPVRDRAPPGELSYAKVHHYWPGKQVELRKLEAPNAEALGKVFAERIKYAVKWVGKKQLEGEPRSAHDGRVGKDSGAGCDGDPGAAGHAGENRSTDGHDERGGAGGVRENAAPESLFETPQSHRRGAPPLTLWPLDALDEWHQANKGKRRVRCFGAFYNPPKAELPDDPEPDGKLRWCGRVSVTPHGFYVEAARVSYIDLIHGDKSGRDFSASSARTMGSRAREGPA